MAGLEDVRRGACVMVARDGEFVLFGNTAQPDGPKLSYTRAEAAAFAAASSAGSSTISSSAGPRPPMDPGGHDGACHVLVWGRMTPLR